MPAEVGSADERVVDAFPSGARIVEVPEPSAETPRYRFQALLCEEADFDDLESARLYADVYFAVGSFREDGTGVRGVPPAVAAAGTATLAVYLLSRPHVSAEWVQSFFRVDRTTLDRYVSSVRSLAAERRARHERTRSRTPG